MDPIDRAAHMAKSGIIGAQPQQPMVQQVVQIQTQEIVISRLVEVGILTPEQAFGVLFANKPVTEYRGPRDIPALLEEKKQENVIQLGK